MDDAFVLYSYFRSSASYRIRIALHYKKIQFKYVSVHLMQNGGEQFTAGYRKLNPQAQVPCLIHNNQPISQSMAIIQYLEDVCREPALVPNSPYDKALVMQFCELINSGIQPLQNISVTNELAKNYNFSNEQKTNWIRHWNKMGLASLEETLKITAGHFCIGDTVTAADCFLIPQIFSAKRFGVDISIYPTILKICQQANELEAFQLAAPENQPDYTS
jgi:maleylacetoacetate isomerase